MQTPSDQAPTDGAPNQPVGPADLQPSGEDNVPNITSVSDFWSYFTDRFNTFADVGLAMIPQLVVAAVILVITWLIARLARMIVAFIVKRAHAREALRDLAKTLAGVFIWLIGGFMALAAIFPSLNPGSIVAGLGIGGIVIGIAFKDIFQNFMAGVMILLRKSMRIGDYIECDGAEGRIERINLRDTYLRRTDGELCIVPNSRIFENPVRVWTDPDFRRYEIVVGVAYHEDVARARGVLQKAMDALDFGARKGPQVFAAEFADSSVNFNIRWWAEPEPIDMHQSRDKVVTAVKEALDGAGIEIPFPYRTLTFSEPLPLARGPGANDDTQKGAEAGQQAAE
ncbi:MAG: mechanosensitive ion channel family protein [Parvularcula sp.]|jgi:small-conductance mechanosensitive channel|nr:mechanosensitive ion channel family protein [Parvularcula sp.]